MSRLPQDPQLSFDELGQPLQDVSFVVLDLETTGGRGSSDEITEIAAVKVRGGQTVGEFATLVNPGRPIPPGIVSITGITDAMVADAPTVTSVLPAFLEFCAGSALVAHNASFDTGFLRAACERAGLHWPKPPVVCTVRLSRRVLSREETPNHKLATLAHVLGARTAPRHRALDDARATVDVLHALLERVGTHHVYSLEDLLDYLPEVTPQQRRNRTLAEGLPDTPGVYLFRGPNEEVLYIGTATNLRRRVRQYFTAGERRGRIREMVALAHRVEHVECTHALEAEVRELRLLEAHQPRYNRRSKFPRAVWWVSLTEEVFPRLTITRKPKPAALGPFRSRNTARNAVEALQDATPLRSCTDRIPVTGSRQRPCAAHEMGRCGAPCVGYEGVAEYEAHVVPVREVLAGSGDSALRRLRTTIEELAEARRFEDAATHRDRLVELVRALDRGQRLAALAAIPELVAARPDGSGGWLFAVLRHGRLASAGTAPRGTAPMPVVDRLQAAAQTVLPGPGPLRDAPVDELGAVYRWLTAEDSRMVRCEVPWAEPAGAAGSWREWAKAAATARTPYEGAD
ncbi:DNA polymerase-3 subunit epsilon [Actinopolyspora mzabensis]|uniref:DNA polymerase-3 subunit epsilon n=1 Tax=Actinopolyspora mzabensis TaxID=995066 RepID=A0A1G9BNY7_ACTMZ|nr:DEDD exonuclease domain-containing protein [Actinopolyspora mzabensis]SDK40585.1 DNA polymerase-3 subunit epsilon [Actinopolyspora mzabensis]